MIAVVTSCVNPKLTQYRNRSYFSLNDREEQTLITLMRLKDVGFKKIIFADNSFEYNFSKIDEALKGVDLVHLSQYQFANKGINEILILLSVLDHIPNNTAIFKISARYFPTENFEMDLPENIDFKIKSFDFESKHATMSTRGYFVKNKKIYEEFLLYCLNEVYSYPYRIVGLRSFWNFVKEFFNPSLRKHNYISVEFAAARVLKQGKFNFLITKKLNIKGQIAGLESREQIEE